MRARPKATSSRQFKASTLTVKPSVSQGKLLHSITELTPEQKFALGLLLKPVQSEIDKLRAELDTVRARLAQHEAYSPGIDIDLSGPAVTAEDAAARRKLTATANQMLSLKTTREMHDLVMRLPMAEAAYYDAWRRQYFLKCFKNMRDYHKVACELQDHLDYIKFIQK